VVESVIAGAEPSRASVILSEAMDLPISVQRTHALVKLPDVAMPTVILAKARIQIGCYSRPSSLRKSWIPAVAGMTGKW
jgi:hypothetical protein